MGHNTAELAELDGLANLMASQPSVEQLVGFYTRSETLTIPAAEKDPYSLVYRE